MSKNTPPRRTTSTACPLPSDFVMLTRRHRAPPLLAAALSMLAILLFALGGPPPALAQDGDEVVKIGPGQARGYEPANVSVSPGHGELTVSWSVTSRPGVDDNQIYHALRWSQTSGAWDNPRMLPWDTSGGYLPLEAKHGILIEPGVTSYKITGLRNRGITGVHVRSFTGTGRTEGAAASSQWVRIKGPSTTPDGDEVIFDQAGYTVVEGGTVTLDLSRYAIDSASLNNALTFTLNTADGTAASTDYTAFSSRSVTMAANAATASSSVVTTSDDLVEEDETLTVSISTPGTSIFKPGNPGVATVTIQDDERASARVAFGTDAASTTKYTATVAENVSGGTLDVPVTVSHLPGGATTFRVEVLAQGTTAGEDSDFSIGSKSVTFGPADTGKTKNVAITVTDDLDHEEDKTIALRIVAADAVVDDLGDHYARDAGATATVTLTNDDPAIAAKGFAVPGNAVPVAEGGNAELTLVLGEAAATDLVFWVSAAYSADPAPDKASSSDTNNFLTTSHIVRKGKSSDTINIYIAADGLVEETETFTVTVTSQDSAYSADSHRGNTATVTIISRDRETAGIAFGNDAASTTKYTATVAESVTGGTLNVPVTVSHLPGASTTFAVEVLSGGTATEGSDFSVASKSVTFGPGDSSKTKNVVITLTDDSDYEESETIELRIVAADDPGNDLGDYYARDAAGATAAVTITSEERRIAFGSDPGSTTKHTARVAEAVSGGTFSLPVTVSHLPGSSTTFAVEVLSGGTAKEDSDFSIAVKSVTFGPDDSSRTGHVAITLTDDSEYEKDETIQLRIAAADQPANDLGDGYARDAGAAATVIITSDDDTAVQIVDGGGARGSEPTNVTVTPGDGELTVSWTITSRDGAADGEIYHAVRWSQTPGAWDNPGMLPWDQDNQHTRLQAKHGILIEPGVNSYKITGLANRKVTGVQVRSFTGTGRTEAAAASSQWVRVKGASTTPAGDEVLFDQADHTVAEGGTVSLGLSRYGAADDSLASPLTVTLASSGETASSADYTAFSSRQVTMAANAATASSSVVTTSDDLVEEDETLTVSLSVPESSTFSAGKPSTATVTIQDGERASARVAFGSAAGSTTKYSVTVAENVSGGTLNVPVTVSHLPGATTTFTVEVLSGGTAREDSDFSIASKSVTFGPTDTGRTQNVAIAITDDSHYENGETIQLRIAAADAVADDLGDHYARDAAGSTATVTIVSDESRIAFGTDPGSTTKYTVTVAETVSGGTLNLPVTVSHLPTASTTFTVEVLSGSTATEDSDFSIASKSVTFGPTDTGKTKNLAIAITNDSDYEKDETIQLRIAAADDPVNDLGDHYARDAGATATVTITSEDARSATKTYSIPGTASATEGGNAELTLTLGEATTTPLEFKVAATYIPAGEGGALPGEVNDFRSSVHTVAAGKSSDTISIPLPSDELVEGPETFVVTVSTDDIRWSVASGGGNRATVTILDGTRSEAKIAFGTNAGATTKYTATVSEAVTGGTLNVPVTVSHLAAENISFSVQALGTGTATPDADYAVAVKQVQFTSPNTPNSSRTVNLVITLTDDSDYEKDETIELRIAAADDPANDLGDHYTRDAAGATATITITSDESHFVTVSDSSLTVERGQTATYTVVLTDKPTADVTVTPVSSSDKATVSGPVTFTGTNWSVPQEITVTGAADGAAAISHTVSSDDAKFSSSKTQSAGVTVTLPPKFYEITSAVTAAEDTTAELTVTLSEAAAADMTFSVSYDHANSSAKAADTGAGRPTTVTVAAGDTTATLSVPIARDSVVESNETLKLSIAPGQGVSADWGRKAAGADTAAITITDATIAITAAQSEYSVGEGDGSVTISITFSSATLEEVTLGISSGGAGSRGQDYQHAGSLTVAEGATTASYTVTILDDSEREGAEWFWTRLDVTTPAAGYAPVSAGITISDNDTAGVVVNPSEVSVRKGSTATYTVKLSSRPTAAVYITPASSDTAKALVSGRVFFTTADWNRSKTITVTGVETGTAAISHSVQTTADNTFYRDLVVDPVDVLVTTDKVYQITATATATAGEGGNAELTVTLLKDAPAGGLQFTVTPVYDTGSGKAVAADLGTPPATVTVPGNGRTAALSIPIARDALVEGDETFRVSVSAPGWGKKADGADTATVTITDLTRTVSLASANYSVGESGGQVTVGLNVSGAHADNFTATVTLADVSATRGADYGGGSATAQVSFAPGETTATLSIPIARDALLEGDESFTVTVTAVSGHHAVGNAAQATVTITDSTRTVSLAAASYSVGESDGKVTVGLNVSGSHADNFTATVTFADVSATRNTDYGGGSATAQVSFAPGETAATLDVAIIDDSLIEGSESFTVTVTAVSGHHAVGSAVQATVTITDDDTTKVTVAPTSLTVAEYGSKSYTVALADEPSASVTVTPSSSATAHARVGGPLTFTTGNWRTPQTITVEGVLEGSATISHAVTSDDAGYAAWTPSPVSVTVTPYDKTYTISPAVSATEGGNARLTITLGELPPAGGLTFDVEAAFGAPAADKADLADLRDGPLNRRSSVTVPSGKKQHTFSIPIAAGDLLGEENETFTVSIKGVTNLGNPVPLWQRDPGGTATAKVTIQDGDAANAKVAFGTDAAATARYTASVSENVPGGTLNVPVTVSHLPARSASFTIAVAGNGTATEYSDANNPGDYRIAEKTVTFGPADTGKTRNVAISITDDADVESAETIVLSITAAADPEVQLGDRYARDTNGAAATITINSDDAASGSTKTYTIASSATASEGGNAELTVTLGEDAPAGGLSFTVSYDYAGGTATSADTGTTPATLTVAPGSRTGTLRIPLATDGEGEDPETFSVTIATSAPGWAKAPDGAATATVTITDATPAIRLSAGAYTVIEGGTANIVVIRDGPTTNPAQVSFIGFGRGPVRGVRSYFSETVTIPAGLSHAALVIETKENERVEGDGSVGIIMQRPSEGYYLDGSTYVLLFIKDNDGGQDYTRTYTFKEDVTAGEGANAELTIDLGENAHSDGLQFIVNYDYSGGEATEEDTGPTLSTLDIAAGSGSATLSIPIAEDVEDDFGETFIVSITPGARDTDWAVAPSGSASATVTIAAASERQPERPEQSTPVSFEGATVPDQAYTVGAWAPYPPDHTPDQERHKLPAAAGGGGPLTYTATGLPPGLTMGQDRIIRGTPLAATISPVTVTYTAAYGEGVGDNSDSLTFQVTVNLPVTFDEAELTPFIDNTIEYTVGQASPLNMELPAATGGTGTLTYHLGTGDPSTPLDGYAQGLFFDAGTRVLSSGDGPQAPTAPQSYSLSYWAEDERGARSALAVSHLAVAAAPALAEIADQNFTVGDAVSITLPAATGGSAKLVPLRYSLEPEVAGLSFDPVSLTLSGTAMASGSTTMTYTVTDRNGVSGSRSFTVTFSAANGLQAPASAPESVQTQQSGDKGFVVTWTEVPGATGYAVQVATPDGSFPSGDGVTAWPEGEYGVLVFEGMLLAGVVVPEDGRYPVRVAAVNAAGAGPWATATATVGDTTTSGQQGSPPEQGSDALPTAVTLALGQTAVSESGGPVSVTATLDAPAPKGGLGGFLLADLDGTATEDIDFTMPLSIFIPDGQQSGTAAISITDDALDEADETVVMSAFFDMGTAVLEDKITLTITDDDTAGVSITAANPLGVSEVGTATYTMVLDSRPTAPVTVAAASADAGAAAVSPASHLIPPANWNTPVTFTVSGVADEDTKDESVGISHRLTSQDAKYAAVLIPSVSVSVTDATAPSEQGSGNSSPQHADPPNRAPTVASVIGDATIVNQSGTHQVSLSGVFSDADSDGLAITAESSDEAVATVSVASAGSSLTVNAKDRGKVVITVTADDGNGGTVGDTFTITVKAAPTVASAIEDLIGLEAGDTRDGSLYGVFSDADNDALTITAVSSDKAIATATVAADGSELTLTGVAQGTATITVTAEDSDGNRVSDGFSVTVTAPQPQDPPPNQAPTVASAIGDATIVHESGTKTVSLSGVFSDADSDSLTIKAGSSDTAKATVSVAVDYSGLTVNAQGRGTAAITVTASDGQGGTVSDEFTLTVKAAPVVASAIGGMSGLSTGDTREVSLSSVFTDADGDTLTYSVKVSDSAVAVTYLFDGTLTVVAEADGTATITVTAEDSDGNTVSDVFDVSVVGPPSPAANLRCVAKTDQVAFLWDIPKWSGGDVYAYDYTLTLPGGSSETVRWVGYPVVNKPGTYQAGTEASISVKAVYELADGSEVSSAAATLNCTVAE